MSPQCPPTKFRLNPTNHWEAEVVCRFSRRWTILAILNLCVALTPPIKFFHNPTEFWRRFEAFQDGRHAALHGYLNGTTLAILTLHVSQIPLTYFGLIRLTGQEEMSFEDFQDGHHGGHLWYRNGKILAVLNLHVAPMPLTKFQLNPTYNSGGDVKHVKTTDGRANDGQTDNKPRWGKKHKI